MAKVPGAANCTVDPKKVTNYLLVPRQKNDKSKFFGGLGFSQANWLVLVDSLRRHVQQNDYAKSSPQLDINSRPIGTTYEVNAPLLTPSGLSNVFVRTFWTSIGDEPPHFVTAYPGGKVSSKQGATAISAPTVTPDSSKS